jgi:hypothetical protein
MSKFDQQMREVERSLAQLGGKTQATKIRKSLEKKIQQAAVKKLLKDQKKPGFAQKERPFYNGLEPIVPFTELSPSPSKGIFELRFSNIPSNTVPVFDEDIGAVVGYRQELDGVFKTFDLNGDLVDIQELPLEKPFLDPIDLITIGGIVAVSVRKALQAGGVIFSAGAAGRKAIELLSQSTLQTLRAVFRRTATGTLKFTATTVARMGDPARFVPVHILKMAIRYGRRVVDPQGVRGASMYRIPMLRNGRRFTLEVVVRDRDRTVLHFLYK